MLTSAVVGVSAEKWMLTKHMTIQISCCTKYTDSAVVAPLHNSCSEMSGNFGLLWNIISVPSERRGMHGNSTVLL